MVRSIFLRGFDQDMANKVGGYMETHGVKFLKKTTFIKVILTDFISTSTFWFYCIPSSKMMVGRNDAFVRACPR